MIRDLNLKKEAVMSLYLVQHGKSYPENIDPEKGLTPEGADDVTRIAGVAKNYRVHLSSLWHSGKKRARQTAEIINSVTGSDRGIEERPGMGPRDDVRAIQEIITDDDIMLVGHMPFMSRLASLLITGSEEKPVFKFQNGGIVCLEKQPESSLWIIKWALMPAVR